MDKGGAELVPKEGQVRVGTANFRRVNLALFCGSRTRLNRLDKPGGPE